MAETKLLDVAETEYQTAFAQNELSAMSRNLHAAVKGTSPLAERVRALAFKVAELSREAGKIAASALK